MYQFYDSPNVSGYNLSSCIVYIIQTVQHTLHCGSANFIYLSQAHLNLDSAYDTRRTDRNYSGISVP